MERDLATTAKRTLRQLLKDSSRMGLLRDPSYERALEFFRIADNCILEINSKAGFENTQSAIIRHKFLQEISSVVGVIVCQQGKNPERMSDLLFWSWANAAETIGKIAVKKGTGKTFTLLKARGPKSASPIGLGVLRKEDIEAVQENLPKFQEWLALCNLALSKLFSDRDRTTEARQSLRAIMATFDLSYDEVGRMFGVSGETVRRWESGTARIPAERVGAIAMGMDALSRLLKLFKAAHLADVIRRKADLFGGERALDWVVRGRIADVADRYDLVLTYQG